MHTQSTALDIAKLQSGQQRHDEIAHRDILALSVPRRVTHFTLHFAKYAGALLTAQRTGNRTTTARVITDSLIIALACSNSLGIDLERTLREDGEHSDEHESLAEIPLRFSEVVGEMAKACEAFDHPSERYPSLDVLGRAVTKLTRQILLCAASLGVDLACTTADRWHFVEAKALAEDTRSARQTSISAAA